MHLHSNLIVCIFEFISNICRERASATAADSAAAVAYR